MSGSSPRIKFGSFPRSAAAFCTNRSRIRQKFGCPGTKIDPSGRSLLQIERAVHAFSANRSSDRRNRSSDPRKIDERRSNRSSIFTKFRSNSRSVRTERSGAGTILMTGSSAPSKIRSLRRVFYPICLSVHTAGAERCSGTGGDWCVRSNFHAIPSKFPLLSRLRSRRAGNLCSSSRAAEPGRDDELLHESLAAADLPLSPVMH